MNAGPSVAAINRAADILNIALERIARERAEAARVAS